MPEKKPKPPMASKRKPVDPYRSVLGTDKDIVGRGNRTPYEPVPKKKDAPKMGYKAGGFVGGHKSADGCAKKGKTKAKQVAMKRGGMC
jgi:hypothetical protein